MFRKSFDWLAWLAVAISLSASLFGADAMLLIAIVLAGVRLAHLILQAGGKAPLRVQVWGAYLALLVLGAWPPLAFLHWIQFVGTWTMLLTGYCFLARCLSLLPWNRRAPLSRAQLVRTFFSPPTPGSILPLSD